MENLFFQEVSDELELMNKSIKNQFSNLTTVKTPVSNNMTVLAKYNDEFYRSRVLGKKNDTLYEVYFIDYGNKEVVSLDNMKNCPEDCIMKRSFGVQAQLDYVRVPPIGNYIGEEAFEYFERWAGENELRMVITRSNKKGTFCELYKDGENEETKSVNYLLLKEGLSLIDENSEKGMNDEWLEAAEYGLKKNPAIEDAFEN